MKKLSVLAGALFLSMVVFAQNGAYSKGDKLLNIGVGLNSYYSGGIPVGASFELGITEDISVGVNVDYLSHKYKGYGADWKFTALYIGARGSYHFNTLLNINNEKVDLYGGAALGYRSFKWNDGDVEGLKNSYGSGVYFGVFAGGKYYFTNNIAGFAELGAIGSTNVRLGVAFKF